MILPTGIFSLKKLDSQLDTDHGHLWFFLSIRARILFLEHQEINENRTEREKEAEETGGTKTGVCDLKSFAGTPNQSSNVNAIGFFP